MSVCCNCFRLPCCSAYAIAASSSSAIPRSSSPGSGTFRGRRRGTAGGVGLDCRIRFGFGFAVFFFDIVRPFHFSAQRTYDRRDKIAFRFGRDLVVGRHHAIPCSRRARALATSTLSIAVASASPCGYANPWRTIRTFTASIRLPTSIARSAASSARIIAHRIRCVVVFLSGNEITGRAAAGLYISVGTIDPVRYLSHCPLLVLGTWRARARESRWPSRGRPDVTAGEKRPLSRARCACFRSRAFSRLSLISAALSLYAW